MEVTSASAVKGDRQRVLWSAIQCVNVVPDINKSGTELTQQETGRGGDEHSTPDHVGEKETARVLATRCNG
jgi:hypothetical protein